MRGFGMGYVSASLVRRALQEIGRDPNIKPPFSDADIAFLTWNDPAQPPHAWERIRGSNVYGPGATGNYSWMNTAEWGVSPEGTEILNLNRDIIRYAARFEDINWNDPRIRLPDSYMAIQPVPELPQPVTTVTTGAEPAPAVPPADSSPVFTTSQIAPSGGGGGGYYQPYYGGGVPMDMPTDETGAPIQVQKAGLFSNLPAMPVMIGLSLLGLLLFGRPQLPGPAPRRRRRR